MRAAFKVRICSDLDYEKMVADIVWNDVTIATIIQDQGTDNMQIKHYKPCDNIDLWEIPLDSFIEAIQQAKKLLADNSK